MDGDTAGSQRRQEGVPLGGAVQHGRDVHVVARAVEPLRQRLRDALQTTEFAWRGDLQDDHGAASTRSGALVVSASRGGTGSARVNGTVPPCVTSQGHHKSSAGPMPLGRSLLRVRYMRVPQSGALCNDDARPW